MALVAEKPSMHSTQPMVRVRDIVKDFETPEGDRVRAVDRISFDVAPSEFVAITGQSGCGKTTLLRILLGLVPASAGLVEVSGVGVRGCDHKRAMVFQQAELLPWRSALSNVELGLETKGVARDERRRIAKKFIAMVGLAGAETRRPDQLSGGMRQRVGLARALAVDPDLLLMDEPFGALDAHTREALQAELIRLHEETRKTVVFVTHDLDEAVLLADRVMVMSPLGRLAAVVDIPIPRRRADPERIRTTPLFTEKRYSIWQTMKQLESEARAGTKVYV
jgi:NitT/TauT family transport system ATP-binding protein